MLTGDFNETWLTSPRTLVNSTYQSLCNKPDSNWEKELDSKFSTLISTSRDNIPWLSSDSLSGSLVKHYVMVQDIMDQEFYTKQFVARNKDNKEFRGTGKYSDILDIQQGYNVDWEDDKSLKRDTRLVYYCVPVPGRNSWTRPCSRHDVTAPSLDVSARSRDVPALSRDLTTQNNVVQMSTGKKRGAEEADGMDTTEDEEAKKVKSDGDDGKAVEEKDSSPFQGLNMVLPTDSGVCCIPLIYTQDTSPFKINDILEITGILERIEIDTTSCDMDEEERARFPPSSIVPRVHCVDVRLRQHINPLLSRDPLEFGEQEVVGVLGNVLSVRSELVTMLKKCVSGDPLAAEYLLLHLLSHVYGRRDEVVTLGKFAVNLTKCPPKETKFVECLSTLFSNISEKSFVLPLTITNFNISTMLPKKDYNANRLRSGLLQLPKGMQIILDETVLEPGQLKPNGIENLKCLGNLITWQKLAYDFGFSYNIEFECDAKVLILGEGKSLLPSDVVVPLKSMQDNTNYEEIISEIHSDQEMMDRFRKYLTVLRHIEYDQVSEELQQRIEQDFVAERKSNPKEVTGDTLHRSLVIARLYGLSRGHLKLEEEDWNSAKSLERDRLSRIAA
ncbi:mini-chromosome maintenance complex-binding protein-like [Bolinopsis microptera]|uniref:mini-chromosome maintenance complex-binding protein-like n=1 Tax=Bolinopsis microptera TaxID=2820187 RepID=UPI00307A884A